MATIASPPHIGPTDQGRKMTLEEFLEAEEEEGLSLRAGPRSP